MAGFGPAPTSKRRANRGLGSGPATVLPAEGRPGQAPAWPLPLSATATQRGIWRWLWQTPQAVAWVGVDRVVARLAVLLAEIETGDLSRTYLTEARQLEDRLGLSPMALLRLRWRVVEADPGSRRTTARVPTDGDGDVVLLRPTRART